MFEYLVFEENQVFRETREIRLEVNEDKLSFRIDVSRPYVLGGGKQIGDYRWDVPTFLKKLEAFNVPTWDADYYQPMLDGYDWNLRYKEVGKPCKKITGSNDGPDCYEDFVDFLFSVSEEFKMIDYLRYTESENGVLIRKYELRIRDGHLDYKFSGPYFTDSELGEHQFEGYLFDYLDKLDQFGFKDWGDNYTDIPMLDGIDWILEFKYSGEPSRMLSDSNRGPKNLQKFVFALNPDNVMGRHVII